MKRTPVGAEGPRRGSRSRLGHEPSKGGSPAPPQTRRPCPAPRNTPTWMVALLPASQRKRAPADRRPPLPPAPSAPPTISPEGPTTDARAEANRGGAWTVATSVQRNTEMAHWRTFGFGSISANAPPVEVFKPTLRKTPSFQCHTRNSPKLRSQQVRRISARRDRFRAAQRRGQCSAPPA